jgi:SAM-dependent methyltransferase
MRPHKRVPPEDTSRFTYPVQAVSLEAGPKLLPKLINGIRGQRFLLKLLWDLALTRRPSLVRPHYSVNERVLEIPFAIRTIEEQDRNILDVGCCWSVLPLELAHLGFNVWGVDQEEYPLSHPNFRFVRGDLCHLCFASDFFDAGICLSTLEHVGLGHYGDPLYNGGDLLAMNELHRVIRPGGKLILTTPFGRSRVTWQRIYGPAELGAVLAGFSLERVRYYNKVGESWLEATEDQVVEIDSPTDTRCVALILARKSSVERPNSRPTVSKGTPG